MFWRQYMYISNIFDDYTDDENGDKKCIFNY